MIDTRKNRPPTGRAGGVRPGRRLAAMALGAGLVLAGTAAIGAPASAATPWLTVDEDGFARFSVSVTDVEAAVGQDVSQIVAEGNFGPSANWAEFGLTISGDRATGILGPLEPGHYYYQVTADDTLTVKDPTNSTSVASEPEWSTFFVAGEGAELMADAPQESRGEVAEMTYRSSVAGQDRSALVWTPPGYDADRAEPYPVLYLQHGGGQSYRDWVEVGRAAQIFDNLHAQGSIEPMVVVMGNGNVSSFADELLRNIVRTAERQYNISSDPAQRALAGLSMGGGQTFDVMVSDPGEFAYLGTFGAGRFNNLDALPAEAINAGTALLRLYVGNPTDVAYNDVAAALPKLDAAGVRYQFDGANPDAGHNWDAWQENLIDFAPRLFGGESLPGMSPGHTAIEAPFTTPPSGTTPTPWVSEDGYVTFETSTEFANAKHVTVWANWGPSHLWTRVELSKVGDRWRGTVGQLEPGWYHYRLIVDRVAVKDTSNPTSVTTEPTWSQFLVPGEGARLVTPAPEGERGTVAPMAYPSITGQQRTALVWTPVDYDAERAEPYPVLYLQHGGGQSYTDWTEMGQAANILDNHYRDGNLEPMVVVMGNGNVPDFTRELKENIVPTAEATFNISSEPADRALAGLSMGGGHTLTAWRTNPGMFSHIGVFSAGYSGNGSDLDVDALNAGTTLLRLYNGNVTDFTYGGVVTMLSVFDRVGIKYEFDGWFEGPHGWDTWQYALADFAPRLFTSATAEDGAGIPVEATVPPIAQGHLSMTVAAYGEKVVLGEALNVGDRLRLAGALPQLTVTDSRSEQQAGSSGWAVAGQSSDLTGGSREILAGHLGWTPKVLTPARA
ncbi:alpha/beta hydrolase-fold protein [Serinibacter arcticus]|nr:alpha/beta hydrolase-fold protein [Serinibacter arcticus]